MPISVTTAEAAVVLLLVAALAGLVIVSSRQRKMLRALAAEPGRWQKRLEDLVRLGESTIWSGSPETAYQKTADALAEVLDCDEVYIHLLAVTGEHLTECAAAALGDPAGQQAKDMRLSITTGRMPQMMADHRPIIMDFTNPHPADRIPKLATELGYKSAASIPLLAGDDMLGIFSVVYKRHQHWTERDIDYLLAIGRLLGVSVQHAAGFAEDRRPADSGGAKASGRGDS